MQPGGEQWTACVTCDGEGTHVSSGVTNLVLLKTTDSAFTDFARDQFTTLSDTTDRILATAVTASWRYRTGMRDFAVRDAGCARDALRRGGVQRFSIVFADNEYLVH